MIKDNLKSEIIALRAVIGISRRLHNVITTFENKGGDPFYIMGMLHSSTASDFKPTIISEFEWDIIGVLDAYDELIEFDYLGECMETIKKFIIKLPVKTTEEFQERTQLIKLLADAKKAYYYIGLLEATIETSTIN